MISQRTLLNLLKYLLFSTLVVAFLPQAYAAKKPNILFIAVDDLRPELGCYGSTVAQSPNIDQLAESGTLFERAYCQVPVCGASRASLMTGMYPTANRFVTYYSRADEDATGVTDLPTWLQQNGYTTISNGKIYHEWNDSRDSWTEFYRPPDFGIYNLPENVALPKGKRPAYEAADVPDEAYAGGLMTNKIIKDLERAKDEGTPFFITAGYTKPHLPFNAPKKYWDLYEYDSIELVDNPYVPAGAPKEAIHGWHELRNMYCNIPKEGPLSDQLARTLMHGYYACVSYTDAMIGRLLDTLDRLDMREETIVILWGDHGWQLGEHSLWCKHSLFETSLHSPLIIRAPGYDSSQRVEALVEFVDIYPTLCDLAGLDVPSHLQGQSMRSLMLNPQSEFKSYIYGRYHGGDSVRSDRFQYTRWKSGAEMLYDHIKDPDENINIVNNVEYYETVREMREALRQHLLTL